MISLQIILCNKTPSVDFDEIFVPKRWNGKYIPFSVISAKARAAERWRSTLSENARVERARRGSPSKKLVSVRSREIII